MTERPSPAELLAAALDYAGRGWRVIVLHNPTPPPKPGDPPGCSCGKAGCGSQGKHPRPIKEWPKHATTDAAKLRAWWGQDPESNVGVALGSGSGLVGVDVDPPHGEEILGMFAGGDLPATLELTTGKGRRLLYAIPDGLEVEPRTIAFKGGDQREAVRFQSTGGQCVLPPSWHPAGRRYAWVAGRGPAETEPAPMPGWLIGVMTAKERAERAEAADPPGRAGDGDTPGAAFNARGDWWRDVLEPAGFKVAGRRDDVTYLTRPGKGAGTSATLNYCKDRDGRPALFPFSTSIDGLEADRKYDLFGAYARLLCDGDFGRAARRLADLGYGPFRQGGKRHGGAGQPGANGKAHPPGANGKSSGPGGGRGGVLVTRTAAEVECLPVQWTWKPWIPGGMVSMIDGDPGLGKSTLTCDLAARVTRGDAMPGESARGPSKFGAADVLFLAAEDSIPHTVRPRLELARADLRRVHFIEGIKTDGVEGPVVLPLDMEPVQQLALDRRAALIVVDPLTAYLGAEIDSHKDQSMRVAMSSLKRLAESTGAAVLVLRHLNKLVGGPALYRGTGSIATIASVRAAMLVGRHPDQEGVCVLAMNKSNVGPLPESLTYTIHPEAVGGCDVSRLEWGEPCDLRATDILGEPARARVDKLAEAKAWLSDVLANGPVAGDKVEARAEKAGIADATLRRAKKALEVVSSRSGVGSGSQWVWALPPEGAQDSRDTEQ